MSGSPDSKIKLNTPILPVVAILMLILAIVDGYRGWAILLVGFGGAWLLSSLWARALSRGIQIHREMRLGWAQVGDRLEERFTLINQTRFPALWVEVIGQTNMPDYWANQVRSVAPHSQARWHIRGTCTRRGLYTLGPTTLLMKDPFGIYTVTLHDPASTTLMVTPPIVPLPSIRVAPGGRAGEGTPRVNAPEQTVSSASVRDYVPGDSLRWIHWPTSARRNDFFVRVFEGAPAGDWWILLDLEQTVQVGEDDQSTQEQAIILAASLTDLGMRTGRSVGLATHGKESLIWHPPRMSDEAKWQILHSLALVEPGNVALSELLTLAQPSLGKNTSLIVITPAINEEWVAPLLDVRRTGAVPTVLLFDPSAFQVHTDITLIRSRLSNLRIQHEIITPDLLERGETHPDYQGSLEWHTIGQRRSFSSPGANAASQPDFNT